MIESKLEQRINIKFSLNIVRSADEMLTVLCYYAMKKSILSCTSR